VPPKMIVYPRISIGIPAINVMTAISTAPIYEGDFRSGLNAPRKAGRRPTLQPPP
jgi:hypothetical protein